MTTASKPLASISPGWSLALGVLLVIAGVLALIFPVIAAVTAALYVGWFAIIAGVIAIIVAIRTRNEPQFGWRLAVGVLYVALGLLLVANPIAGAASLALLVGALMAASGVVEIMLAFRHKPKTGWGWLLADGIVSLVFAVMIAVGWPLGSLVLIGYLVGFQIITCGIARIALAVAARKAAPALAA
jgi:membrane protein HdeD